MSDKEMNIPFATGAPDDTQKGIRGIVVPRAEFAPAAKALKADGWRLMAEWAADERKDARSFGVYAAYNKGQEYILVKIAVPENDPVFPTLTKKFTASYRFERQIQSLMGLIPSGHPDPRPWIKHEDWPADAYPLRKDFDSRRSLPRVEGEYAWFRAEGEGIFEIAVGPVHAGIIEPGHFRFQAVGEDIINLETRFGYVHKGIEKRFEEMDYLSAVKLAGRVSGDTTVAHSLAYCRAVEAASGCVVPQRAHWIRGILLELERIANHLGDIGAICNDTAFTFMLYQCAILRERVLRATKEVFGHRLAMDRVVPGGVTHDVSASHAALIRSALDGVATEFERLVPIYEDNPSLEDRLYSTGILKPETAKEIGAIGIVGRASGQRFDARVQDCYPPYNTLPPKLTVLTSGDVHARAWVRIEEVRDSMRLVHAMLDTMPEGPVKTDCAAPRSGTAGFATVEGWRGEIVYWVRFGGGGMIERCAIRDPSSVCWLSIEQAIKGNIVPDFPLCNKSFNQSYSGHDL